MLASAAGLFRLDEESYAKFRGVPGATAVKEGAEGVADVTDQEPLPVQDGLEELDGGQWAVLSRALQMTGIEDNPRAMIVFEFVFDIVHFCAESGFDFSQMSTVLGIFGDVFCSCWLNSPSDKEREDAVTMFTQLISAHARPLSAGGAPLLSVGAIKRLAVFFADTVIKQFDAYQYVMSELPVERIERVHVVVQTPVSSLVKLER